MPSREEAVVQEGQQLPSRQSSFSSRSRSYSSRSWSPSSGNRGINAAQPTPGQSDSHSRRSRSPSYDSRRSYRSRSLSSHGSLLSDGGNRGIIANANSVTQPTAAANTNITIDPGDTITIFTKPDCPNCALAKTVLTDRHVPFQEIERTAANDPPRQLPDIYVNKHLSGGWKQLLSLLEPTITVNIRFLISEEEAIIQVQLDRFMSFADAKRHILQQPAVKEALARLYSSITHATIINFYDNNQELLGGDEFSYESSVQNVLGPSSTITVVKEYAPFRVQIAGEEIQIGMGDDTFTGDPNWHGGCYFYGRKTEAANSRMRWLGEAPKRLLLGELRRSVATTELNPHFS